MCPFPNESQAVAHGDARRGHLAQGIHAVRRHRPAVAPVPWPCTCLLPSYSPRPRSCCRRKGENKWLAFSNIVDFPRPEGRSVSDHHSGGGSPIAASLQRRTSPVAGPNRAQATYPIGGRWRRGTIPGTPRIRILVGAGPDLLAYVRAGPVSSQKPGIAGASHHRTKEVHHRTEEVLRPVGLYLPGVWSLDGRA